jgi:hypothetical protein
MLSSNENPNLLQVIGNRRIQTVSVQKPPQTVQQQMTSVEASVSPNQQGQMQTSSPSQNTTQPQHSPQQVVNLYV